MTLSENRCGRGAAKPYLFHNGFLGILLLESKINSFAIFLKPRIFGEKRGVAALLTKNSGFYFVRNPY